MTINANHYISDKNLLSKLLRIPMKNLRGETLKEMIFNLMKDPYTANNSGKAERIMMVHEVACRYGGKKLELGEPFRNSVQIYDHFRFRLENETQERFLTVLLDNKHRIIKEQIISLGTLNQSLVHPREVFAPAIEMRAAAIVLIHNHPSGDPQPSNQDVEITKRLVEVGNLVGIRVIDHVIVGANSYYSFVDENIMP